MRLSYRGEPFHGWQTQPGAVTVQQTIEEALGRALRRPTPIVGAGRTDAGVNARLMVAHFDTPEPLAMPPERLVGAVNAMTGRDIAIHSVEEVAPDLHARFSATSRTYHYYALPGNSAFLYPLCWKAPADLDYEAMNRAASLLLETKDFTSFAKLHSDAKTNICHVTRAEWVPWHTFEGTEGHVFVITADRFLRNMIRAIVGTLVDVGRGRYTPEEFERILTARDLSLSSGGAPAQGLFLSDVVYPENIFERK